MITVSKTSFATLKKTFFPMIPEEDSRAHNCEEHLFEPFPDSNLIEVNEF